MLLCLALWFELGIQHEQSRCDLSLLETYNIEWRQILIKYQIHIITWQCGIFFSPFLIPTFYLESKPIYKWCVLKVEERESFSMIKAPELCQEAGNHWWW